MDNLKHLLRTLEQFTHHQGLLNQSVSGASVGWHIEHSLLAIDSTIDALQHSNPNEYKWKLNVARIFVFSTGRIPRGRAEAPEPVRPRQQFTAEELRVHVGVSTTRLQELNHLHSRSFIAHPVFGSLSLDAAIRSLEIHTGHHIRIIQDILKRG